MATLGANKSPAQQNGSVEERVLAVLRESLAGQAEIGELLNTMASMVTSLEVQLSTWVGTGGARAITERANQLTSRSCSILSQIHFNDGTAVLEPPSDVNDDLLAEMLEACLERYVVNIFKVVESLTGNVLIDKLLQTIANDRK